MPNYLILICENEAEQQRMAPSETKALVDAHAAYVRQLEAAGAYRDGERLRPAAEGRRVRAERVEPGPFGEEEAIAGYYLVEAADLPAAVALAAPCPLAPGDTLDVRSVLRGEVRADKASWQGKTFAFVVLGSAATEGAWVELMDRIEADAHGRIPDDRFLGGVRLEPPGRGQKIVARRGTPSVMDGPFLESKEVVGGLFFMRMADLDEAVRWARGTTFMRHGALEVRELWRS